jgi:hypothetical protein
MRNLGEKAEKVVEFDTEVFYHGRPGEGTVEHDDFVWIHVDSPGAKP